MKIFYVYKVLNVLVHTINNFILNVKAFIPIQIIVFNYYNQND